MKKKLFIILNLLLILNFFTFFSINQNLLAQGLPQDPALQNIQQVDLVNNNINIHTIYVPFFKSFVNFSLKNASFWTWLTFAGSLIFIILVFLWVVLIIKAGVSVLQKEGSPEAIAEAGKQVQSVFIGIFFTFTIPIILSLVGTFLGIGNVFQWPKMFSKCEIQDPNNSGINYNYYFQVYLAAQNKGVSSTNVPIIHQDPEPIADSLCGIK